MNYGRLALAAVAAWIVDAVYGFIVYGNVLTTDFARYPGVFRPQDAQGPFMPVLFAGILLAMFAAAYIYAKGYEGGSGTQEGMRFGVLIGLLVFGYHGLVSYAVMNLGRRVGAELAIASLVEWTLAGIVIGFVYRPSVQPRQRQVMV